MPKCMQIKVYTFTFTTSLMTIIKHHINLLSNFVKPFHADFHAHFLHFPTTFDLFITGFHFHRRKYREFQPSYTPHMKSHIENQRKMEKRLAEKIAEANPSKGLLANP